MNIILMLIGVVIVYNILRVTYRDNWSRNLSVDVTFSSNTATKGDTIKMVETVTNAKRMPLPCVNIKFSIDKNLVFGQDDNNSRITDKTYRNDVFSLLSNQRVTRKIDVLCARRGVYRLEAIETVFAGAFMNDIMINNKNVNHMITVYPKPENVNNLLQVNNSILGELERRKYLLEDKFVFAGIRDYQSYDSIRDVNWNASARTGKLMVNQYNETVSRNVCILLNLESEGVLMQEDVIEQAISIAAGLAQLLIGKGINVSTILMNLGIDSTAFGFAAGFTGEEIIREVEAMGIRSDFIKIDSGISRINLKLKNIDGTEINGSGPEISEEKIEELLRKLDILGEGDILVLAGSIPASMPADMYSTIMERLQHKNVTFIVDATKDLLINVLKYKPFLIKPNNHELGELFDVKLTTREEVIPYGKKLQKQGARNVLISMAGEGAVLVAEDGSVYEAPAPKGTLVNAVGAGDSMVAGFTAGWIEKKDYRHAFYMGVSAGSASAFSEYLATKEEIMDLYEKVSK